MVVERDRPPFRNGAKCTSYTVWPKEYLGPLTPQALLTNINIQKHIAQASVDKRFSCCSRETRKKNKPKKHSRFTLQNARFEPYSYTVNSHVEKSSVSPLAVSHRGSLPAKKRKKKHKKSCEDPYHIKDIDQFDSLVAEFTAEEKDTVANACEVSCERSQEVSHGETDKKDQDAVGNESSPSEEEERNREDRFTVYVRQLDNKVVGVTLHPGDTLDELRTAVKCPAATVKFYHRGKQLLEKLLLNEQGIAEGSNIDVHVGLLGGADNDPEAGKHDNDPEAGKHDNDPEAGKHDNDPEAGKHELSENMEEWSEDDVVRWLTDYVKLKEYTKKYEKYIKKVKEEEIDGYNVKNTFTVKYLRSTIQMKSGPALKLIGKRDAFVNKTVEQEDKITSMSVEEVCAWLKDYVKLKKEDISKFRDEEFDGWNLKHSLNEEYLKKTMIGMKSGPMDRLLQKAKQFIHESSQPVVRPKETKDAGPVSSEPQTAEHLPPASPMKCAPREFGQYDGYPSYPYGWVLDAIETGPTDLINPAREFKFSTQQGKELVKFFLSETLPFFCACLNVRTNGTIYFGITDCKKKGSRFGEVVGLPLNDEEKANLEESLTACMTGKKCFQKDDQRNAAQKCYRLAFVKVSGMDESRYVIEVDIVPKAVVCGSLAFFVCLPQEKENKYYKRVGSSSCSVSTNDLGDFLQQVTEYSSLREEQEKKEVAVKHKSSHLAERLKSLFCHDSPKKMSSFYHILVANKPPADLIEKGCLDFIKCIDWVAVLDFDPDSYTTGLAKLYKEKGMSEYFSEQFSNEYNSSDMKGLCYKIKFRTLPLWLSCNGRKDMERIGSHKTCSGEEFEFEVRSFENSEWNRNRRVGVKDAILFLSKEEIIPDQAKVVITFLLFSEDYEIVVDTFRNFADYFKLHRLMYIAEKDTMLHGWNTELEKAYAKDEHKKRGIVGMPWWQVNEFIKRLTGVVEEGVGFLPSVTGHEVVLKERDRKEWNYLDVVCTNECENSERLKDKEEFKSFREEKEENFWKGKKVDWWNFWFTENHRAVNGQVLRRENHDNLKDMVVDHLKGNIEGEQRSVNVVQLFHHPGAGGSTMARQILWDLRKKYRCAVVKSPKVISCEQILNLYLHGKTQHYNPVLILIDEPDFGEAELRDFKSKIEQEINKRGVKVEKSTPVCVLLHCMSSTSAQDLKQQNPTASFVLEQYLSEDEQRWCNEQLEKSMQNCPERNPHQFLSFMIFKNNFDRTYIEETVRGILSGIDMAKSEKLVLKYVSLLNKFVKGSAIPVVRCKALLGINPRNPQADQVHDLFSQSAQLLLVEVVKEEEIGTVPCYSTAHPLLAEEILNQLLEKDNQTLGELALEFLKSKIFMDYRFGREYVVRVTGQMLKGRAVIKDDTDNKDRKEDFSPLILQICDQEDNAENAVEIMKYAYDRFADGILAQQAARLLYIRVKNFEEARKYARKAVADKRSSYTLDTLGQVEKGKFKHRFQPYIEMQSELSPEHAKEAIKLAFDTMDCFQEAQKASKSEGARNLAGFCGEVQICFLLLELLDKCVPLFKGRERLRELLMSDDLPPDLNLIKDFWDEFKTLGVRIDKTLDYLADIDTRYKHDILSASKTPLGRSETSSPTDETIKKFLQNNYQLYALYFCISPEDAINHVKDEAVKCKLRRSQVTALGGNNFFNIFQHVVAKDVDTLKHIMGLLKANVYAIPHRKPKDIQNFILVNLALVSVDPSAKTASLNTFCDLCEKLVDLCNGEEAYPYFLLYMFMWPLENTDLRYDHTKFKDALKKLIEIHNKHKRSPGEEKKPYDRIQAQGYQPQPSTLFFLGKASDSGTLKQFIHVSQLPPFKDTPKLRGLQGSIRRDQFWKDPAIREKLCRLKGSEFDGKIYVQNIRYSGTNLKEGNIEVRAAIPSRGSSGMRQVSFYLGFSWDGPVAYDVQIEDDNEGAVGYSGGYR